MSEWIKCSERLPGYSGLVIVYRPDAHHEPASDNNVTIKPYSQALGFGGCHIVTHWQPLPQPPEQE